MPHFKSTRPSFLGHAGSDRGLFVVETQSHQGIEGFYARVPNSIFKVGTERFSNLSKTSKNQSYQGFIRFWSCPKFGPALFRCFSSEIDGEASHSKGLRGFRAGFWCPKLSQLFEEKPLRLCKGGRLFMHEPV